MTSAGNEHPVPLADQYDVLIVGMGPVGATLANLLALRSMRVLVLDREPEHYALPRAVQFDGECMRVFQTIGIDAQLQDDLLVVPGMRFVDAAGRLLVDWSRPLELGPHGWHASYRFHQPNLERALRRRLCSHPTVDIRTSHDVFSLETRDDDVSVWFEDLSRGKLLSTRARYVIGCDGARSTVRRFMGTELDDLKLHERWLVIDVMVKHARPDLGDHSVQFCDPERPATYVRGIGARRRWEIMLRPGEDGAAMSRPENAWALLSKWLRPEEASLERAVGYTFHSVVARGWRRGRLMIAGDAAHQTPPFAGQGMCAGIRDAANLAWKLVEVLTGRSNHELLDTYETERSPHVREFIDAALLLGRVIRATGQRGVSGESLQSTTWTDPEKFTTPDPKLGPGVYDASAFAGRISEQPKMDDGRFLDDVAGYRELLVTTEALARAAAAFAGDMPVLIAVPTSPIAGWLERLQVQAALVRPDRYLAGTAVDRQGLEALLAGHAARCCRARRDAANPTISAR
jgi:3-(3-hydroxy-phenyl)propionate hydroxylase